jgi:hypothetical protein
MLVAIIVSNRKDCMDKTMYKAFCWDVDLFRVEGALKIKGWV